MARCPIQQSIDTPLFMAFLGSKGMISGYIRLKFVDIQF